VTQLSLPPCNADRGTGGRKRREGVGGGELVRPLQHRSVLLECRLLLLLLHRLMMLMLLMLMLNTVNIDNYYY
jgi:hypothetical protein